MYVSLSDLPPEIAVQILRTSKRIPCVLLWKSEQHRRTIPRFFEWFGLPAADPNSELIERIPEYFQKINSDLASYLYIYWFFAAIAVAVPLLVDTNAGLNVLATLLLCNVLWFAVWSWNSRRRLHDALRTPITVAEAESIKIPNHRDVEDGYKHLLKKAIETSAANGNRNQILSTLRIVGEAVVTLPKSESSQYLEDPEKLIRKINELKLKIDQESDTIVGASYERQLDAVKQSLTYANQQIVHKKRLDALKEELLASLQTVILSINATAPKNIDTGRLQVLSESIREISAEARSLTSAVAELEGALHDAQTERAGSQEGETVMQTLGRR